MKKTILLTLILTTLCLLAACGKTESKSAAIESESVTELQSEENATAEAPEDLDGVHIYSDNPEEISVAEDGKTITISLKGNATTGYMWSAELFDKGVLEEVSSEYIPDDNKEGLAGAGGIWTATYTVKGNGRATILSDYAREWETDPIESRQITVTVADGQITDVENVTLEIEPSEEETTAAETAPETEAETVAETIAETPAETQTPETEVASLAPIPEETVFVPEEGNDMGCLDDGLTW